MVQLYAFIDHHSVYEGSFGHVYLFQEGVTLVDFNLSVFPTNRMVVNADEEVRVAAN